MGEETSDPVVEDDVRSGDPHTRFLGLAGAVQGGVLLLAIVGGWLTGVRFQHLVRWELKGGIYALLAVVPLLGLYQRSPGLRRLALQALGSSLSRCRWYELLLLAVLAGVGEELLFRGVLYDWGARWNPWAALLLSNVAFGLLHALSRNYFLTTTAVGLIFHGLAETTGQRNLLIPIITHAVYDYVAFELLVREWRSQAARKP